MIGSGCLVVDWGTDLHPFGNDYEIHESVICTQTSTEWFIIISYKEKDLVCYKFYIFWTAYN